MEKKEVKVSFSPCYIKLSDSQFTAKIERLNTHMFQCNLCPRHCGINRTYGVTGFCKAGKNLKVASFNPHMGEEPPISGTSGSGTIFFSNCQLKCVFCQNYPISIIGVGAERTVNELADIMLQLQKKKCHNINLVTPDIYIPQIIEALYIAKEKGLCIPIVFNSGGYTNVEVLKVLEGLIDIYMPDMKFSDDNDSKKLANVENYWAINKKNIKEMYRQVGTLTMDENDIAQRGLIIRHLVMPGKTNQTEQIMKFIAEEISEDTYVSLMNQYFPTENGKKFPEIADNVSTEEYKDAIEIKLKYNLENGWIQLYNETDTRS